MAPETHWFLRKIPAAPHEHALVKKVASPEACEDIIRRGREAPPNLEDRGAYAHVKRNCKISWLFHGDHKDLSAGFETLIRGMNDRLWRYDLACFEEAFQYAEYYGAAEGRFDAHTDTFFDGQDHKALVRKVSMALLLSDPAADFEGGRFIISDGTRMVPVQLERGDAVVFPSHLFHAVEPVTSGTRRSLVLWVWGPPLR